jgi:WD40 repeat protein
VNALAVSPDGTVVAATTTITARTWEIATGIPGVTISGGHDYINAVAFDPSGALLATASDDRTARVWDPLSGAHVRTLSGHDSWVYGVEFSPRGDLIATALRSAGFPRTPRSSQLEPFISLSTTGSHLAAFTTSANPSPAGTMEHRADRIPAGQRDLARR